ncbi:hypothetical protein [Gordonia sp. NPDC003376]
MHIARNPRRRSGLMMGLAAAGVTAAVAAPFASAAAPIAAADAATTAAVTATPEPSPIMYYQQVIAQTLANLQEIGTTLDTQGATPILAAILANQAGHAEAIGAALGEIGPNLVASLQTDLPRHLAAAQSELAAGNVDGALNQVFIAVLMPVLKGLDLFGGTLAPIVAALSEPLENLDAVVKWQLANTILIGGIALISPIAGAYGGLGDGIQALIDAAEAGDAVSVVNALLTFPGKVASGFLNGGTGPDLGAFLGIDIPGFTITSGGLLGGADGGPNGSSLFGSIPALQSLQHDIAAILDGTSPFSPHPKTAATSSTRSITVTLPTAETTDTTTAVSTPGVAGAGTAEAPAPETITPAPTTPAPITPAPTTPAPTTPEASAPGTAVPETATPDTTEPASSDSGDPACSPTTAPNPTAPNPTAPNPTAPNPTAPAPSAPAPSAPAPAADEGAGSSAAPTDHGTAGTAETASSGGAATTD